MGHACVPSVERNGNRLLVETFWLGVGSLKTLPTLHHLEMSMPDRYLVSCTTPSYVPKTGRYFNSLPLVVSAKPVVILVDFTPETDPEGKVEQTLRDALDWVEFRHMPMPATASSGMVQDSFISVLDDIPADALVVLTDLDIEIQRDFTDREWEWLEQLKRGQVAAYWNCLETDNLALEARRIGLSAEWKASYGDEVLSRIACMNCGVLVARAGTFRDIQPVYESLYHEFASHAPHRSRCQFLLNWVWHRMGIEVVTLPGPVHQHAHLRDLETGAVILPKGAHARLGTVMYEGVPVIFKHAFN